MLVDLYVASYASIHESRLYGEAATHHFLGLFHMWIPVPATAVEMLLSTPNPIDFQHCHYRGIRLAENRCVCIPSWSMDGTCAKRMPSSSQSVTLFQLVEAVLPEPMLQSLLALGPWYGGLTTANLLSTCTVLEVMLVVMLVLYLLHRVTINQRSFYAHTTLCWARFHFLRIHSLVLCHFLHMKIVHLLWNIVGLYSVVVPLYATIGGSMFHSFFSYFLLFIAAWKLVTDKMLRTEKQAFYGMEYFILACTVVDALLRQAQPVRQQLLHPWKFTTDIGRIGLQHMFLAQFLAGRLQFRMHVGSAIAAIVYLLLNQP